MVEATGLEPAASWSQTKHSTKLSYASKSFFFVVVMSDSFYIIAKIFGNVNTIFAVLYDCSFYSTNATIKYHYYTRKSVFY